MKKRLSFITIIFLLSITNSVHAHDPCKSLLCLANSYLGEPEVQECRLSIGYYFRILSYKINGIHIDWNETNRRRLMYLSACENTDNWPNKVNARYGRRLGLN